MNLYYYIGYLPNNVIPATDPAAINSRGRRDEQGKHDQVDEKAEHAFLTCGATE